MPGLVPDKPGHDGVSGRFSGCQAQNLDQPIDFADQAEPGEGGDQSRQDAAGRRLRPAALRRRSGLARRSGRRLRGLRGLRRLRGLSRGCRTV